MANGLYANTSMLESTTLPAFSYVKDGLENALDAVRSITCPDDFAHTATITSTVPQILENRIESISSAMVTLIDVIVRLYEAEGNAGKSAAALLYEYLGISDGYRKIEGDSKYGPDAILLPESVLSGNNTSELKVKIWFGVDADELMNSDSQDPSVINLFYDGGTNSESLEAYLSKLAEDYNINTENLSIVSSGYLSTVSAAMLVSENTGRYDSFTVLEDGIATAGASGTSNYWNKIISSGIEVNGIVSEEYQNKVDTSTFSSYFNLETVSGSNSETLVSDILNSNASDNRRNWSKLSYNHRNYYGRVFWWIPIWTCVICC